MAVLKMDIIFVSTKNWTNPIYGDLVERLLGSKGGKDKKDKCSQEDQQECCAANKVNSERELDTVKDACKKVGCKKKKCPKNKKKERRLDESQQQKYHLRALQTTSERYMIGDDLTDIDFNDALEKYTILEPITSGAVIDATNLTDVAICRANSYNSQTYNHEVLTEKEYDKASCDDNDYYYRSGGSSRPNSEVIRECCCIDPTTLPEEERRYKKRWCRKMGVKCSGGKSKFKCPSN